MQKYLTFLFILVWLQAVGQQVGNIGAINDSILEAKFEQANELRLNPPEYGSGKFIVLEFEPCKKGIFQVEDSAIRYQHFCENNEMKFWIEGHKDRAISVFYCEKNKKYFTDNLWRDISCKLELQKATSEYKSITEIPKPAFLTSFSKESELLPDSQNRILFIDASSYPFNNFHTILTKGGDDLNEAKALNKNGNLTIFLKNFNASQISKFIVTLNETDYVYKNDFKVSQLKAGDTLGNKGLKNKEKAVVDDPDLRYLKEFYTYLESIKSLSSEEVQQLAVFKSRLSKTIEDNAIELSAGASGYYYAIMAWSPVWINLTPLPLSVPDTDQVKIKISATGNDGKQSIEPTVVGNYKVIGGWVFDLGGRFYATGLRNNEAYVVNSTVNGSEGRYVKLKEKDQLSIGYGINAEMSLRTGTAFRPTLNLGTFIPFEEEINPYLAIGPGFNIQGERVKFSFLGGLAVGSVNVLNEQYTNRDLSEADLVNVQLTQKAWKTSWFVGVGVRYSLKSDETD